MLAINLVKSDFFV